MCQSFFNRAAECGEDYPAEYRKNFVSGSPGQEIFTISYDAGSSRKETPRKKEPRTLVRRRDFTRAAECGED